ncbi:MAG: 50S ribosomal protein L29 [Planctomycetes bacterium]|nr:50S ribosomal protein L29 [Planctomycetota bacterium]HRJ78699.1 50S ribosomal protein L29 [Planctomycetota bacterium]
MATKFEEFRTQPEAQLKAKHKELTQQNFQARFTSEAMTPAKGAQIKARRRDLARIQTVLVGRAALLRLEAEQKKLDEQLKKLGKADPRNAGQRKTLKATRERHAEVSRAIKALSSVKAK